MAVSGDIYVSQRDMRGLIRACDRNSAELGQWMRSGLLELAEPVRRDASASYAAYSVPGAIGLRAKVTRVGEAVVVQTLRKSRRVTRRRRNFGPMMMRESLIPALESNRPEIEAKVGMLLNRLEAYWQI